MNDKNFKLYLKLFNAGHILGCHQMPERSFFIGNWQLPVCARCTGVFIGQLLMLILFLFNIRLTFLVDFIFLFIMFLDWFIQYIKVMSSNNIRRLLTGTLAGMGMTSIYFKVIVFLFFVIMKL